MSIRLVDDNWHVKVFPRFPKSIYTPSGSSGATYSFLPHKISLGAIHKEHTVELFLVGSHLHHSPQDPSWFASCAFENWASNMKSVNQQVTSQYHIILLWLKPPILCIPFLPRTIVFFCSSDEELMISSSSELSRSGKPSIKLPL